MARLRNHRIADEVEEPPQQGEAVSPPETEPRCVPAKGLNEGRRRVIASPDRVDRDLSHRVRALVVSKQIISNARGPRDGQSSQPDPLVVPEWPPVKTDIRTSRLPSRRKREVVAIRRQVADPVQGRGRSMRHHALLGLTLPRRRVGHELQPSRAELEVVRGWCDFQAIHAVGDSLDEILVGDEAIKGRVANFRTLGLVAGEQAPLVCGDGGQAADGRSSRHRAAIYPIYEGYCSMVGVPCRCDLQDR